MKKQVLFFLSLWGILTLLPACGDTDIANERVSSSFVFSEQEILLEHSASDTDVSAVVSSTVTEQPKLFNSNDETISDNSQSSPESVSESSYHQITKEEDSMLNIQIGENSFTATLAKNSTVDALKELLSDGPLTLHMSDYAGMEKGADLGVSLPQNNESMNTQAGDIILYQGKTFVIYYDTNSWSLTPIGKITSVDADTLRDVLGPGDITVTISLAD